MTNTALPMFPLGTVIFPFTLVPLRVFEPRYQALVDRCLAGDRSFGSVLIERGSEVGGGDQRFAVGTRLRLTEVSDLGDGHRLIHVAGIGRLRVVRWIPDDPYPLAVVEELPDDRHSLDVDNLGRASSALRTFLALASELGVDVAGIKTDFSDDRVAASYQLSALTPVTPLDAYRLLSAPGPAARLDMAEEFLDERSRLMRDQLGGKQ